MLESQQRRDLVRYRIEKAYKSFEEAKGVAKLKFWNLTGNRLYYTVFHMASPCRCNTFSWRKIYCNRFVGSNLWKVVLSSL